MDKSKKFTHFDDHGNAVMVDVSRKDETRREAVASGRITMSGEAFDLVKSGSMKKGDVLGVARLAGIMAAKKVDDLIPLTHPLMITKVVVDFDLIGESNSIEITATVVAIIMPVRNVGISRNTFNISKASRNGNAENSSP